MKKIIAIVGILAAAVFGLSACDLGSSKPSGAQANGQAQTETAFAKQQAAVPYPADQLTNSLERQNLRERLLRTNKPDAIGYVYLLNYGKVFGYYSIKGKVSSTQSQMTTDNLIEACGHGDNSACAVVVNAPGDDGSYGQNEPGIFFFTTEGAFVTTSLDYVWSDQPLPFNVPKLNHS